MNKSAGMNASSEHRMSESEQAMEAMRPAILNQAFLGQLS
jgi:hypothetical protein